MKSIRNSLPLSSIYAGSTDHHLAIEENLDRYFRDNLGYQLTPDNNTFVIQHIAEAIGYEAIYGSMSDLSICTYDTDAGITVFIGAIGWHGIEYTIKADGTLDILAVGG